MVAVLAKPKALGESRIAAGIVEFVPEHMGEDDMAKEVLKKTIQDLREKKVSFRAATNPSAAAGAYLKSLTTCFEQSRFGKGWKKGKDEVRAFLLSADLFPKHAEKFRPETSRGCIPVLHRFL